MSLFDGLPIRIEAEEMKRNSAIGHWAQSCGINALMFISPVFREYKKELGGQTTHIVIKLAMPGS